MSDVLGIFAHPDDESILVGGTLAACAAAGLEVAVLSLTRGERGGIADRSLATRQTLGARRELELNEAAQVLGVRGVECLSYSDGELSTTARDEILREVTRRLAGAAPSLV